MTTPAKLNEFNAAENPARLLLQRLGWTYLHRNALVSERREERDVLLRGRLRGALLRLNPWLSDSQADSVIGALERVNATGMARNQAVHEYLTYGMPFDDRSGGSRRTRTVRFFDFDNPQSGLNEFVVTTQFRVRRASSTSSRNVGQEDDERMVIPDLVLFVNGIPLVVMEAKSPTLGKEWQPKAVRQLRRYQEAGPEWQGAGAPELFHYNLMCVAHSGVGASYAAMGAPENAYFEWKSMLPYSESDLQGWGVEPHGQAQLIAGLLAPSTLLDILRDYVVYEQDKGRLVKKLPRYQQYRAVVKAMERVLAGGKPEERGGVVWHTQGSGKSLTMLWMAVKVRREPKLAGATVLIVTDRTQLDRQIAATFEHCGFPAPEQATSTRNLRRLLTTGVGRTIMTTVQKFEDALSAPQGELDVLNAGDDVVVMVDEAHRTQYGLLGARMSKALPNAALIGFTGTPIDRGFKRSTMQRFGTLIDAYTIPQAVEDGATVPIHYEPRLPDLAIEGADTLDRLFDALFGDETEDVRQQIRRRYANKEAVAEAEQRIEMIALDIAEHYKDHVRPNGFKAQVVAPSRRAALRYAERLNSFGVNAVPIITWTHNDGPEFQVVRDVDQEQVISAFLDPEGEPEALVVVDMLLTGFDAPVEQVLYLDRPLREHSLLQAIARVNRRFSHRHEDVETEKQYGLVMDYYGISRDLNAALSTFEWGDVQDVMQQMEEDPAAVAEAAAARAEAHFRGHNLDDTMTCIMVFAPDADTEGDYKADLFERFNADYRQFSRTMDRFLPDPRALAYVDRLRRLTEIRAVARAQYLREDSSVNWTEVGAKVKRLLDERISADVRQLMKPVSVLDKDFEAKVSQLPHEEARASVMEHAIRASIHERIAGNPAFYERLSDQLARIIRDLRDRVIDAAEASKQMELLRIDIGREEGVASELGLSPLAYAVYGILTGVGDEEEAAAGVHEASPTYTPTVDESVKATALQVEAVLNKHTVVVDWRANGEVLRLMRRDLKRDLRRAVDRTEEQLDTMANRIVDVARQRSI